MDVISKRFGMLIFIVLLGIGLFFRVWRLDSSPIALFGDEIDVGLQAYSLLTTGKDYLGNVMPFMPHSFSEYRLPMQLYMDIPFIKLFGLSALGVRGAAILMGVVTLIAFYFLVKTLFAKKVALIAVLFLTFSPWHFNFSRQANDAGILLPFVIMGTLFFLKSVNASTTLKGLPPQGYRFLLLSAISFALSIYTYAISTLFVPLFAVLLVLLFWREIFAYGITKIIIVGIIVLVILLPYGYKTVTGISTQRISYINVAPRQEVELEVARLRTNAKSVYGRLFYNKYTLVAGRLFENYMQAISPTFLFARGDPNPRHAVTEFGQMYHYDAILVLIGVGVILSSAFAKKSPLRKLYLTLIIWFLLAPLPAILTKGGGMHAPRLILMLPPLIIFSALGFNFLLTKLKGKLGRLSLVFLTLVMIFEVARFLNMYFIVWPKESWRFWHYGYKELFTYTKQIDTDYKRVIINNTYEPSLGRFLFYYGYDIQLFHNQFTGDVHKDDITPGLNGFAIGDKYYFGELKKPIERLANKDTLVIASYEKDATNPGIFDNPDLRLLDIIYSPDNLPIFYIYTGQ